jgi:hypothetical protein
LANHYSSIVFYPVKDKKCERIKDLFECICVCVYLILPEMEVIYKRN